MIGDHQYGQGSLVKFNAWFAERHGNAAPRHIGDRSGIAAVDALRRGLTRRAPGGRGGGSDPERDPLRRRCVCVEAETVEGSRNARGANRYSELA